VAVLNPNHLFEQASKLIASQAGPPRQVDIRRAISAAYYATFHATITAAADQFVGVTSRDTSQYGLVYRSVSHAWLRDLCREVQKTTLPNKLKPYAPINGFGSNIAAFAAAVVELQEKRHAADYDVMIRMNKSDAILAISTAKAALRRFEKASKARRVAYLSLLLFSPRP
jgi:uncharacterized protein (UPF0332 family)